MDTNTENAMIDCIKLFYIRNFMEKESNVVTKLLTKVAYQLDSIDELLETLMHGQQEAYLLTERNDDILNSFFGV